METEGWCKNISDTACYAAQEGGSCAIGLSPCTEEVNIVENQLEFSFLIEDFTSETDKGKFSYVIEVKDSDANITDATLKDGKIALPDLNIMVKATGDIVGGDEDKETVDATVKTSVLANGVLEIKFEFDLWATGRALYYDPGFGFLASPAPVLSSSVGVLVALFAAYLAV